jgi:DNA-binding protein YbaB
MQGIGYPGPERTGFPPKDSRIKSDWGMTMNDLRAATASIAESSESDQVTAEVDGNGTLTGFWMDDSVSTLNARTLATVITSTTQEAARLATEQRTRVMTTLQDGFGRV